jgi:hypothetical protein
MALKDMERVAPSGVDVLERGKDAEGNSIGLDRRLFMQLLAFGGCVDSGAVAAALAKASSDASFALYEDLNDPDGIAILACHEEPGFFVGEWRQMLKQAPLADLQPKPEMTMFGRTYSLGYEQDLEETLIGRPRGKVVNPKLPWAIWYPLRRDGAFEQLPAEEQRTILMEHGGIGMAYGRAGLGTDIRLASHGLDKNDNDFTVALLGPNLAPLSKIVERMRKTKQTSQYLKSLGPFFVGKVVWQSKHD